MSYVSSGNSTVPVMQSQTCKADTVVVPAFAVLRFFVKHGMMEWLHAEQLCKLSIQRMSS